MRLFGCRRLHDDPTYEQGVAARLAVAVRNHANKEWLNIKQAITGRKELVVIELTAQQRKALQEPAGRPLSLTDPATCQEFILVPRQLYDSLRENDGSPWTDGGMDALAAELDVMLDDDIGVEDDK
jgi:hypothetical protein